MRFVTQFCARLFFAPLKDPLDFLDRAGVILFRLVECFAGLKDRSVLGLLGVRDMGTDVLNGRVHTSEEWMSSTKHEKSSHSISSCSALCGRLPMAIHLRRR